MERNWDVIVAGAGPAGATTAMILAQAGRRVLLLDRATFPRDKICGDAVPGEAFATLWRYGMAEKVQAAIARGHFYPVRSMRLISPGGHMAHAPFSFAPGAPVSCICPRIHFDALLFEHAVASGAEYRQAQVKDVLLENGQVVGVTVRAGGTTEALRAQVVIAADGVTSVIARRLRPEADAPRKEHRAIALRAYITDLAEIPHEIEFYLYNEILPGYAWIFPTGYNTANIGLGMRIDKFEQTSEKLEQMLARFLAFPDIRRRLLRNGELRDVATWQLNFGSQRIQRAFNGALLVGDAGGFINPLTGGGIHNAIISAELAAHTADAALAQGDLSWRGLREYDQRCDDALWDNMQRSFRLQRLLLNFPWAIDGLVRLMGGNSRFARTFLEKL
jgi:geranylgeranyl reductase family protein